MNEDKNIKIIFNIVKSANAKAWIVGGAIRDYLIKQEIYDIDFVINIDCLLYTSPSPRDLSTSRMPSTA